jgi:hypothetical protein
MRALVAIVVVLAALALGWLAGERHRSNCIRAHRVSCSVLPWDNGRPAPAQGGWPQPGRTRPLLRDLGQLATPRLRHAQLPTTSGARLVRASLGVGDLLAARPRAVAAPGDRRQPRRTPRAGTAARRLLAGGGSRPRSDIRGGSSAARSNAVGRRGSTPRRAGDRAAGARATRLGARRRRGPFRGGARASPRRAHATRGPSRRGPPWHSPRPHRRPRIPASTRGAPGPPGSGGRSRPSNIPAPVSALSAGHRARPWSRAPAAATPRAAPGAWPGRRAGR